MCVYIYVYIHIYIHIPRTLFNIVGHDEVHIYTDYTIVNIYVYVYVYLYVHNYIHIPPTVSNIVRHGEIYMYRYVYIYIYICEYVSAHPYESSKNIEGLASRDAPSKLVQLLYKTFPPDHIDLAEMKNPTRLSNKTSTAWSCAEDQILENTILGTGFELFVLDDK